MVQEPVQNRGGQDRIAEDLAPVDEALVAGQDDGGAFVASCHQPEEQAALVPGQGQISDFIEDKRLRIGQLLQLPIQAVFLPGTVELDLSPINRSVL